MDPMAKIRINSDGVVRNLEELAYYLKKHLELGILEVKFLGVYPYKRFANATSLENVISFLMNKFDLTRNEATEIINRLIAEGWVDRKDYLNGSWIVFNI